MNVNNSAGAQSQQDDAPAPQPGSSTPSAATPADAPPASTPPASAGCAEIPTASHVVLTAEVKMAIEVPFSLDEAGQMPHKFTLSNDDNSYSKALSLASDA